MKKILICICVFSIMIFCLLCALISNYKNNIVVSMENRASKIANIISFISVAFVVLTLIISIIGVTMQLKSPELEIGIYTIHEVPWEEENESTKLCLAYDRNNVSYDMSASHIWHIHITNKGNQYAENVKIRIKFEDFVFVFQPDYFTLSDPNYGMGSYGTIEHIFNGVIQPGETVDVPEIPVECTELYELEKSFTNMSIKIYENNSLVFEKDIPVELIYKDEYPPELYISSEDKIIRKLNEYYFNAPDYLCEDYLNPELYPKNFAFSLEEHEVAYKHYLSLISVYNPVKADIYSKLTVFYGRLFYGELSTEITRIDIEQAIENDMTIRWKYG